MELCQETLSSQRKPHLIRKPLSKKIKFQDQSAGTDWMFRAHTTPAQTNPSNLSTLSIVLSRVWLHTEPTTLRKGWMWPHYHPCLSHSDQKWDILLVIRLSPEGRYLAGNAYLADCGVDLNEQSTPQARPHCHAMMVTDLKNLIMRRNYQICPLTVKNVISEQVPNYQVHLMIKNMRKFKFTIL